MKTEELHTINRLAELTDRDRRTIKQHLRGVRPAKVEQGRKLYRLADVEHLSKPKAAHREDFGEWHWLLEYTRSVISAFDALCKVFTEQQKISRRLKSSGR